MKKGECQTRLGHETWGRLSLSFFIFLPPIFLPFSFGLRYGLEPDARLCSLPPSWSASRGESRDGVPTYSDGFSSGSRRIQRARSSISSSLR
jgi:hypothetical protein